VASIFVNPTQFAPHEDLSRYPRTWESDVAALKIHGCTAIFSPTASEMYPPRALFRTFVVPRGIDEGTPEGAARPGFFRGVSTVVLKLLNIVNPTDAWFGQKDGIQCIVLRGLCRDLNVPCAIHVGPTAREEDGLALSSRNVYLTPEQRAVAGSIYAALREAKAEFQTFSAGRANAGVPVNVHVGDSSGLQEEDSESRAQRAAFDSLTNAFNTDSSIVLDPSLECVRNVFMRHIERVPQFSGVEYCAFSDASTGFRISTPSHSLARNGAIMLSVVVRVGGVRLLDNIMLVGSVDDLGVYAQ